MPTIRPDLAACIATLLAALLLCQALIAAPTEVNIQGNILRVGQSRVHTSIQSAVNAANNGDLILVDAGTYASFDVIAKGVSIVNADPLTPFDLTPNANQHVAKFELVPFGQSATLMGCRSTVPFGNAAPVTISNCLGSVRLIDVHITPTANLTASTMPSVIRVDRCASVSLYDVSVYSTTPRRGELTTGVAAPSGRDLGISAVIARESTIHLQRCRLRGYDNLGANNTGRWGGDGLRLFGKCVARIDDAPSLIAGGAGGEFGGSSIHLLSTTHNPDVLSCGVSTGAFAGGNAPKPGGALGHNHDRGVVAVGLDRLVPACLFSSAGWVRTAARMRIGQRTEIEVGSFFARNYLLAAGPTFTGRLRGFCNALYIDLGSPLTSGIASGVLTGTSNTRLPVQLPSIPSLAGLQFTLQAAMGPPAGQSVPPASLTLAQVVVITP